MVRGGAYAIVPDPQRPGQLADPWSVGEYVLQQEGAKVKSLTNRHSLFFIPMQYVGFAVGAAGLTPSSHRCRGTEPLVRHWNCRGRSVGSPG